MENLYTTADAAQIITEQCLPANARPRTSRSVALLCRKGQMPGAYMIYGDWCIPKDGLEEFISNSKKQSRSYIKSKKS